MARTGIAITGTIGVGGAANRANIRFIKAYAIDTVRAVLVGGTPNSVRAQEGNHDLRAAETIGDLIFPLLPGPNLSQRVLPDFVAEILARSAHKIRQGGGVTTAIAEEEPGF